MKDFINPLQVFVGETCLEAENHNASLNKHYIIIAQTFNDHPSGVIPRVEWQSIENKIRGIFRVPSV